MDWFYHDPGQGRVGPLSADDLRNRYRDRRIQGDTLVWRDGMREWQPLERMAEELDLLSVKPDSSRPPPLPPGAPMASTFQSASAMAAPMGAGHHGVMRPAPRRGMSGCLIALIVCAVLAVPVVGILAAIAVPAYNDYLARSKVVAQVDARAPAIEAAVAQAMAANGRCPASATDAGIADAANLDFGNVDGRCAFRITIRGVRAQVDGGTVVFVAPASADAPWDCTGGDLPARFRSLKCRPEGEPTP